MIVEDKDSLACQIFLTHLLDELHRRGTVRIIIGLRGTTQIQFIANHKITKVRANTLYEAAGKAYNMATEKRGL